MLYRPIIKYLDFLFFIISTIYKTFMSEIIIKYGAFLKKIKGF